MANAFHLNNSIHTKITTFHRLRLNCLVGEAMFIEELTDYQDAEVEDHNRLTVHSRIINFSGLAYANSRPKKKRLF